MNQDERRVLASDAFKTQGKAHDEARSGSCDRLNALDGGGPSKNKGRVHGCVWCMKVVVLVKTPSRSDRAGLDRRWVGVGYLRIE